LISSFEVSPLILFLLLKYSTILTKKGFIFLL
jgi:hypothetical protein